MTLRNTNVSYGSVAKVLHWLIFVLVFCMIVFGFLLSYVPKDYAAIAYNTHKLTGLTILCLMVLRLLWALVNAKPQLPQYTPAWRLFVERSIHFLMYAVLIGMPLSGWIGSMAAGRPPHLGSMSFDLPIDQDKAVSSSAFDIHTELAYIIIFLVAIHVLAAVYHHFVLKDNILRRMWFNR